MPSGRLHRSTQVSVPPLASSDVVAQFQTCETAYPDGSHDRILDTVPA